MAGWRDVLEVLVGGQHARQDGARDRRIIDAHQPDGRLLARLIAGPDGARRHRREGLCHTTPTICSLLSSVSRSNGFMTYSSAPASIAARLCAASFLVVQNTTLGWLPIFCWRSVRRIFIPPITGDRKRC